jgi:DNA-binding NarL/FixJ family response regulator
MQLNHTGERLDSKQNHAIAVAINTPALTSTMSATQTLTHSEIGTLEVESTMHQQGTTMINVLLVDDHALMREGLRRLLELEEDMRIIGEAVDGFDALHKIRRLRPDVVLMDIRMPLIDGIALTRQIVHEFPTMAVIMLTMFAEQQQMLQAIKNGARGYLLKTASSQEVAQAIRMTQAGEMFIQPGMTGAVMREFRRLADSSAGSSATHALSERDIEILRYVAAGMSNKEIAGKLAYSEKTVKNYLSLIFQKLGIRDRTQAAIFALRHGFLPEEDVFR